MKILIVDDDFTSRKILQQLLSPYGTCDLAVNGKEAVDFFQSAVEEKGRKKYDLICLDIMMPVMNGHETLKEIRNIESNLGIEETYRVKIIMVSALSDMDNVMKAVLAHSNAYISKPITKEKIENRMRDFGFLKK